VHFCCEVGNRVQIIFVLRSRFNLPISTVEYSQQLFMMLNASNFLIFDRNSFLKI
jgi:hypothetical protein